MSVDMTSRGQLMAAVVRSNGGPQRPITRSIHCLFSIWPWLGRWPRLLKFM